VFTSLRRTFKLEVSEVTTELDKGRSLEGVCVCEGGGGGNTSNRQVVGKL
jgi:hypothetical protein